MSVLSIPIPRGEGSVSEQQSPMVLKEGNVSLANDVSGYRQSISGGDAIRKCREPTPENTRNRIRMSRGLSVYSNSEYVCAISPIAIAVIWGEGGRGFPSRGRCLCFSQF